MTLTESSRGFVGKSVIKIIKDLGIRGQAQGQAVKALSSAPEQVD